MVRAVEALSVRSVAEGSVTVGVGMSMLRIV
jgi:hypothetical protein